MRPFQHTTIVFGACLGLLLTACFLLGLSWWWLLPLALIYTAVLVLGSIFIRWDFYLVSHHEGRHLQWIALSFDDGPASETAAILDILKEEAVPAAFFTIGKNAAQHPELVRRWDEEGHLIGNHSYSHGFNFSWQSAAAMTRELRQTNDLIRELTGRQPVLFRPPYGVTNPNIAKAVRRTGMRSVGWSIRSFDTTAPDPQRLLERLLEQVKGGDIILLHDSVPATREILTALIRRAREKGFTFVRADQLIGLEPYA